jgi:uncharacterized membrane protein
MEYAFRTLLDRGDTHPMMLLMGGLTLVALDLIDDKLKCSTVIKAILGGLFVTLLEFIIGGFYMYVLHDPIWFYGTAAIFKVISVTWSMLWCALCFIAILVRRLILRLDQKLS